MERVKRRWRARRFRFPWLLANEPRGIEPKLGTAEELHALIEAAHDRDIRVMMDFVVNHVHEQHTYYEDNPEWFNAGCICGSPNCDWTEHRLDCQFTSYMPEVNWKIRDASDNSSMMHCGGGNLQSRWITD